jgi:hypothetical protein
VDGPVQCTSAVAECPVIPSVSRDIGLQRDRTRSLGFARDDGRD